MSAGDCKVLPSSLHSRKREVKYGAYGLGWIAAGSGRVDVIRAEIKAIITHVRTGGWACQQSCVRSDDLDGQGGQDAMPGQRKGLVR